MTYYYWDEVNDNVFAEEDENGEVVAEYFHEPGLHGELIAQRRDGKNYFYEYDGEGNTRAVTDENGDIVETATYSAFGEVIEKTSSIVNPFGYKGALGYYTDTETGNIDVRRRTYQPSAGRWLSLDPIGFVDGSNRYVYAHANPINIVDPSGELCIKTGPLYYQACGKSQWKSGFLTSAADQRTGGFLIQRIEMRFVAYGCCENGQDFIASDECPKFFHKDPSKGVITLVYWEIVNLGKARSSPVDEWKFGPEFEPSTGDWTQSAYAWFHPGNTPPDGAGKWKQIPNSPAKQSFMRCDKPTGDPGEAGAPIARTISVNWNCCGGETDPSEQVGVQGTPVPNALPGTIALPFDEFGEVSKGKCL